MGRVVQRATIGVCSVLWTSSIRRMMAEKSATRGASVLCALVVSFVVSFASQAAFVDFVVTNIDIDHEGTPLTVYTVAARFDGPQDVVLLAFGLSSENPENFKGFWHKDAATAPTDDAPIVLTQSAGSWSPALVLKPKLNRGFDSYLTIGGEAGTKNATTADPSWAKADRKAGLAESRGWSRADLPSTGITGWFLISPPGTGAGRVGESPNYDISGKPTLLNPATDVRLAQFVLSRGHAPRAFTLKLAWNDATPGRMQSYAAGNFVLGALTTQVLPQDLPAKSLTEGSTP